MIETLKVGVAGVRGVVGASFTPHLACSFAQAFGTFVGRGTVIVGRDTRPSGLMIEAAVAAGLQSVGCKPILTGVAPTPTLLLLTKLLAARGGIAITASHNPAPWNALKFIDSSGIFLSAVRAEELFDIYHQQEFPLVAEAEIPAVGHRPHPVEEHFKRIVDYVKADAIRGRRFKVAVDMCNGVGAVYTAALLRDRLGCEVVPVFGEPTGRFEREPEPLPQNIHALCETVVREKCAVGFAQDPDGDRLALVDEQGRAIGEDLTLAFAVQQVLDHHGVGPVAINLTASKCVEQVAKRRGARVIRTRVGETNVTEVMLKEGCVVGGEHTGGVIVPAIHPCRDSFAAMALVLELMALTGATVSGLRSEIPEYAVVREKLAVRSEQSPAILRALRRHYADRDQNLLDGLYIDFGDAWVHVRRSNTEPVMRVTAEARSLADAEGLAREFRLQIERAMSG
jgi:phosphomannomutase